MESGVRRKGIATQATHHRSRSTCDAFRITLKCKVKLYEVKNKYL